MQEAQETDEAVSTEAPQGLEEAASSSSADDTEQWKKYDDYALQVDPRQDDRATQVRPLALLSRPHMRALLCSGWGYFLSFFVWYVIAPLLSEIRYSLQLSKRQVYDSSVVGVCGVIAARVLAGPLCDRFGARICLTIALVVASISTAMTGLVNSYQGLAAIRFFMGFAGGAFVICQYWTSSMFAKNIVGSMNGVVAGWGSLGSCLAPRFMRDVLLPAFSDLYSGGDDSEERAWRVSPVVPAVVVLVCAPFVHFFSDDTPRGNYAELRKHGSLSLLSPADYAKQVTVKYNTWLLFIQFACCYGGELTMNNAAALYFRSEFFYSTEGIVRYLENFCFMRIGTFILGGCISDLLNYKIGMRGRLIAQMVFILVQGILIIVFSRTGSEIAAKTVYAFTVIFSQAAQASTFAIAPYVNCPTTGFVMGIVGAGGNIGAICFGQAFRNLDYHAAFIVMGALTIASSVLSAVFFVKAQSSLFCEKSEANQEASRNSEDVQA